MVDPGVKFVEVALAATGDNTTNIPANKETLATEAVWLSSRDFKLELWSFRQTDPSPSRILESQPRTVEGGSMLSIIRGTLQRNINNFGHYDRADGALKPTLIKSRTKFLESPLLMSIAVDNQNQ